LPTGASWTCPAGPTRAARHRPRPGRIPRASWVVETRKTVATWPPHVWPLGKVAQGLASSARRERRNNVHLCVQCCIRSGGKYLNLAHWSPNIIAYRNIKFPATRSFRFGESSWIYQVMNPMNEVLASRKFIVAASFLSITMLAGMPERGLLVDVHSNG